ncbi:hypothetical protein G6F52_014008 [Rhizopus delemar]|nr:hypothetical protein G6F52_014008 [Rhizopus delemar]
MASVPGITVYMRAAQDINLGAGPSRTQYQYALRGQDSRELSRWAEQLTTRLRGLPQLRDVSNDQQGGASALRRLRPAPDLDHLLGPQPVQRGGHRPALADRHAGGAG